MTHTCESNTSGACENGNDTAIPCSDSSQCASGTVCCGTLDSNGQYFDMGCQETCDPSQSEYTFCSPAAATDVCASIPTNGDPTFTCQASAVLTGYYVCNNGDTPNPSP